MTIRNNAIIAAKCSQRITALKKNVTPTTEIGIGGVTYKGADLIAIYQLILDTGAALIESRAKVASDLAARRAAQTKGTAIEFPLKQWVLNHFGADSNAAREFGFAAPKTAVRHPQQVANAVMLAKATRAARGTRGKKQRLLVKGSLDAPPAPAVPATHPAPAAAAPPAAPAVHAVMNGGAAPNGAPVS